MAIVLPKSYGSGTYQLGAPSPWESMAAATRVSQAASAASQPESFTPIGAVGLMGPESTAGSNFEFNRPATAQMPTVGEESIEGANAAAFGRAKDQAAQTAQASLAGLRQALQARGMGGGGYEAGQIGQTLAREANQIGEASRSQAEQLANAQQRAIETRYQGDITQRGQDIGAQTSAAALRAQVGLSQTQAYNENLLRQRAQDIQQQQAFQQQSLDRLRTVFAGLGSLY